jgi:hypothetical protein
MTLKTQDFTSERHDSLGSAGWSQRSGNTFTFTPTTRNSNWVEAEAHLPDGRRIVAATNVVSGRVPPRTAAQ